jgi:hypothetical protein
MDNAENSINDLQIRNDEYVRITDLLTSKQIEKHIEKNAPFFFKN